MKTIKKIFAWIRKQNEFTFVLALIALIWYAAPPLLRMVDPQAAEFSIEILYIPLIAAIFFFIGLLVIWAYMKLVFPRGFDILDNLFANTENYDVWDNSKLLLRLFGWLVVLYGISLLAVTGISAIM